MFELCCKFQITALSNVGEVTETRTVLQSVTYVRMYVLTDKGTTICPCSPMFEITRVIFVLKYYWNSYRNFLSVHNSRIWALLLMEIPLKPCSIDNNLKLISRIFSFFSILFYSIPNLGRSSGHNRWLSNIPFPPCLFSAAVSELTKSIPVHS